MTTDEKTRAIFQTLRARTVDSSLSMEQAWLRSTPSQRKALRSLSWHWEGSEAPRVTIVGRTLNFRANGLRWAIGARGKVTQVA